MWTIKGWDDQAYLRHWKTGSFVRYDRLSACRAAKPNGDSSEPIVLFGDCRKHSLNLSAEARQQRAFKYIAFGESGEEFKLAVLAAIDLNGVSLPINNPIFQYTPSGIQFEFGLAITPSVCWAW